MFAGCITLVFHASQIYLVETYGRTSLQLPFKSRKPSQQTFWTRRSNQHLNLWASSNYFKQIFFLSVKIMNHYC